MKNHGGFRKGAGRPRKRGVPHAKRAMVKSAHPMHVTMKLASGMRSLRTKASFAEFRKAVTAAKEYGLRVLEFAVLHNHIHLMVEADSNKDLERGMKSLTIRLARNLKIKFKERYHLEILRSPMRVMNAIAYILTNAAKHYRRNQVWDWYSSIAVCKTLGAWGQLKPQWSWAKPQFVPVEFYETLISEAQSWLGRTFRQMQRPSPT